MTSTKVVTPQGEEWRFSYLNVFEPKAISDGQDPKYSASLIIPKKCKKSLKTIEEAVKAAIEVGKASKFGGKVPSNLKLPLRDGDEERPDDPAYADSYFLNANGKNAPGVFDENRDPIMDRNEVYSGAWGRASIGFYAFNTNGNRGIACGLNGIQKLRDDEPLDGRGNVADDFADDKDFL